MNALSLISILLIPAGVFASLLASYLSKRETRAKRKTLAPDDESPPPKSGYVVLASFTVIVVLFGVYTAATHWNIVTINKDLITFAAWLLLTMAAGMFAQVIMSNAKRGQSPFRVTAGDLLLPLVVSPIVFYAIWSTVASAPKGYFVVYCAFLNGYFWEGTVSKAKPDKP